MNSWEAHAKGHQPGVCRVPVKEVPIAVDAVVSANDGVTRDILSEVNKISVTPTSCFSLAVRNRSLYIWNVGINATAVPGQVLFEGQGGAADMAFSYIFQAGIQYDGSGGCVELKVAVSPESQCNGSAEIIAGEIQFIHDRYIVPSARATYSVRLNP